MNSSIGFSKWHLRAVKHECIVHDFVTFRIEKETDPCTFWNIRSNPFEVELARAMNDKGQ